MAVVSFRIDLSSGEPVQVVPPGQRITGFTIYRAERGVLYGYKLGNNPVVAGLSGKNTVLIADSAPDSDVRMGLQIQPDRPAPGQSIDLQVSFSP